MQRCNIRHVKEGAFRGLGRLVFLNLANNNIEILYQVAPAVDRVSPPRRVFTFRAVRASRSLSTGCPR